MLKGYYRYLLILNTFVKYYLKNMARYISIIKLNLLNLIKLPHTS